MNWYKTLNIDHRINLRGCCFSILGLTWDELSMIFSFREKIDLLYTKLKYEELI